MTLEQALQWADTFGAIQSSPPTGDAPALTALAAEVRRLQVEVEKAKAERNRSGVIERLKYLPQLKIAAEALKKISCLQGEKGERLFEGGCQNIAAVALKTMKEQNQAKP